MIFTSFWFILFVVVLVVLFHSSRLYVWRTAILALANTLFYLHFAGPAGVIPIAALGCLTYFLGLQRSRFGIDIGIILSVLSLIFYKYTTFIFDNAVLLVPQLKQFPVSQYVNVTAPLAISFFVFEFVHYLVEVRKGRPSIEHPMDFFHFAMFFPTLVAGPIKRYEQFLPALKRGLVSARVSSLDFEAGIFRVACGFAKKLTADSLSVFIVASQSNLSNLPLFDRWLVLAAIAMRIYLDFSGYSDMAIGVARTMGIKIPENFNWPYLATNIKDFWRRWHISLSSWIRDYIYIPLGGARTGAFRKSFILGFAFMLCGLWHGAAWNYILWGLYHGLGLILNHTFSSIFRPSEFATRGHNEPRPGLNRLISVSIQAMISFSSWLVTTAFVWSGWLLFFYPPKQALAMFLSLFNVQL